MKISNNSILSKKDIVQKFFSDHSRIKREKYFYFKFNNRNLNMPKMIGASSKSIFFKKYKFKKIKSQKLFLNALLNFLIKTNNVKKYELYAKENLKSYNQLYKEIVKRFEKLNDLKIEKKYLKKMNIIKLYIENILKEKHTNVKLVRLKNLISQSDIGFHNCAMFNKNVFFYDFEYSGLDHPIKLICDTYYQPEKRIDKKYFLIFIKELERIFKFKIPENFFIFEKLLKIKMMLIILNIFVTSNISNLTKSIDKKKLNKLKLERLNKAINYIKIPFIYE